MAFNIFINKSFFWNLCALQSDNDIYFQWKSDVLSLCMHTYTNKQHCMNGFKRKITFTYIQMKLLK